MTTTTLLGLPGLLALTLAPAAPDIAPPGPIIVFCPQGELSRTYGADGADMLHDLWPLDDGGVLVCGEWWGSMPLPGTSFAPTGTAHEGEMFLARLNCLGQPVWVAASSSRYATRALEIEVDGALVHVEGTFFGSVDFDPLDQGASSSELSAIFENGFRASYALTNGAFVSAQRTPYAELELEPPRRVAELPGGERVVIESFRGRRPLPPGTGSASLSSAGRTDALALHYDAQNQLVQHWAWQGPEADHATAVAYEPVGAVLWIGGTFEREILPNGSGQAPGVVYERDLWLRRVDP